jgi:L-seryl-tRNA(Ser) seleniumtransferase
VIAALEATLLAYLRKDFDSLPTLRMISVTPEEIGKRASRIVDRLKPFIAATQGEIDLLDGQSVIGGGSTPAEHLPTKLLAISGKCPADQLEQRLRTGIACPTPQQTLVLARVSEDRLILDLRTVFPSQDEALTQALIAALN